jgi:hypothetical protein
VTDTQHRAVWGFVQTGVRAVAAPNITATGGDGQLTTVGSARAIPLVATATNHRGKPLSGVTVTFTVMPGPFASACLSGRLTAVAVTDAAGRATAPR